MAWAELDGGRIRENLRVVRNQLGNGTRICAVMKANAYGHGLREMTAFLAENRLAEMLAAGTLYEAAEMEKVFRRTGNSLEILILGFTPAEEAEAALREGRILADRTFFSVYSPEHFRELEALGRSIGEKIRVHLRLDEWDSGIGIGYAAFRERKREFFQAEGVSVRGLYGHMYTSYGEDREATRRELEAFDRVVRELDPDIRRELIIHVQNSPLVFHFPEYAYDMARIGTAMYGLGTREAGDRIKPVMRVCGRIYGIREVGAKALLSYESGGDAGNKRKIARIMLGYGDCPQLLSLEKLLVRIRGKNYSLADEPCMDQLCVDITGGDEIREGDTAVLMGPAGLTASEICERNGVHYVHSDWMTITTERLEKVLTEDA